MKIKRTKRKVLILLTSFFIILLLMDACSSDSSGLINSEISKQKIILDTDMDSDVDDAGALAMLLNLHKAEVIDLIGVIVTSDDPYAPVCASVINAYYGFPDIPVGFLKGQSALHNHSRYTKQIAEDFPSAIKTWNDAEDAVSLYRKLLTNSGDESVTIVTIGHLSSLQGLLQSLPDQSSRLNGQQLSKNKVKRWVCMGGQFPSGKEANFYRPDPHSTVYCIDNWEKEVVFCGWEAGNKVITGGERLKNILETTHPVYMAFELYNKFAGRPSWDQLAVLYLLNPSVNLFSTVTGRCIVAHDGSNTWEDDSVGKHQYLVFNPQIALDFISYCVDNLMAGRLDFLKEKPFYTHTQKPVNLIFDTDMLTDCDDAAAMGILHSLADLGEVNILATMVSSKYPMSGPVVDVINTYCGRPNMLVGTPKNETGVYKDNSVFLDKVASEFPHSLQSNDAAPDAMKLYREILSSQADSSVVILTVGYMSNLETLLKSEGDQFSELSGRDLVKKKVKTWVCMGGNFPVDPAIDNVNFTRDATAAVYAINNWPGDIIFAGREIGHNIFVGEKLRDEPFSNPIRRAYELHRNHKNPIDWDHHTADPCAVLLAVRGLSEYWEIENEGYIDLKEDCSFAWTKKKGAKQAYIIQKMDRTELGSIMENLLTKSK